MNQLRAAFVLTVFFASALLMVPIQAVLLGLRHPAGKRLPHYYFKGLRRVLGLKIEAHGEMVTDGPVLIAANHVGYFDIPILGALGPVAFIAKSDVGRWPLFGTLSRLVRTIYVDRTQRLRALHDRDQIQSRLAEGDRLVLFPEGTSSDGNRVLPFKSSLMSVAELDLSAAQSALGTPYRVRVQPVSITYTGLGGLPMGRARRPLFAWYGDMDLIPHLWEAMVAGPLTVVVHFHPPVTAEQLGTRKALARHCETVVRAGVVHALAGRPGLPAPVYAGLGEAALAAPIGAEAAAEAGA